jgi:flavin reductase (DIM6/NTAB) family NADH-FMN oxidoreductase RutF
LFSETIRPPRAQECPVQLEAVVEAMHIVAEDDEVLRGSIRIFELRVQRVHLEESILMDGEPNRIDPDKWRPLIMSFQKFYVLEQSQLHESTLGKISETLYRTRDADTARAALRTDAREPV